MNKEAIKDLLYRLADDELIIGHRNSEWTGMGPILEEDIAFASMAQDEIGHAQAFYMLLQELGEQDPDTVAFTRPANLFKNSQLVEHPNYDYAFSLARHFCYEVAEFIRLNDLCRSSYKPLAELAAKLVREEKYHFLHAKTWFNQLANANQDSYNRMQTAFNQAFPMAFSLFEPTEFTDVLAETGVQSGELVLLEKWAMEIENILKETRISIPNDFDPKLHFGGRVGIHTEHLNPLVSEMTEVYSIDPSAKW